MERQGRVMNGAVKGEESALTIPKGGTQQSSVSVSAEGKVKKGPDDGGGRPSVTVVPVARLPPPVIKLEPLDVKQAGSGDEVQSMDVR